LWAICFLYEHEACAVRDHSDGERVRSCRTPNETTPAAEKIQLCVAEPPSARGGPFAPGSARGGVMFDDGLRVGGGGVNGSFDSSPSSDSAGGPPPRAERAITAGGGSYGVVGAGVFTESSLGRVETGVRALGGAFAQPQAIAAMKVTPRTVRWRSMVVLDPSGRRASTSRTP